MKKDILTAAFVKEMMHTTYNMWRNGWDERNGGNLSYILDEDEVSEYLDINKSSRSMKLTVTLKELAGKIFIVTGSGKYFKNVIDDAANNMGIVKVHKDGKGYDILWGFEDGSTPTSELAAHFMSHVSRLEKDPNHRVVMHTHATNIIAMTFAHDLDEKAFTKTLWEMCTECLVVFPEGVGILPWMLPGSDDIGRATAEKMKEYRSVIWSHHGIFVTGTTMDETFGLVETIEKAADVYVKVCACGGKKQTITDEELKILADGFGVTPKAGILK